MYGIESESGELIAIGGLNQDPYSNSSNIGRVRHLYVRKCYRRKGLGKLLLLEIIQNGFKYFNKIVLRTPDNDAAQRLYEDYGFSVNFQTDEEYSHYLDR